MVCHPWHCMTGWLAMEDAYRNYKWECAGWMVFVCRKKKLEHLGLHTFTACIITIVVIDWYHQRAGNFLCFSEKTLLQSSGPFRAVNEPSSHEQNSSSGFGGKWHQHDTKLCL